MAIQQEITFNCSSDKVYQALTDANQFSAFTDTQCTIDSDEGGSFSCFDGNIVGRHIELQPNERIVQAWRVSYWPEGIYSVVRFQLQSSGDQTQLTLDHSGYPDEGADHLDGGWHKMYWQPLKQYLES